MGDISSLLVKEVRPDITGKWSEPALRVLKERYLAEGETAEEMCWRVALAVASAEYKWGELGPAHDFYCMMVRGEFLPNSPTLMNAGRSVNLQYSACYVLPIEDSIEGIYTTIKNAAVVHQSGGGTGFSFSRLRPRGSPCKRSGGHASGPVSFLQVFDAATEAIKQGGRRRGANMAILSVHHSDILEFIDCKLNGGITNFNISVAITDKFMQDLADLDDPLTGRSTDSVKAKGIFDKIVQAAWKTGDPGLFFIDRCNSSGANPTPSINKVEATNPCVRGDTLIDTASGPVKIKDLVGSKPDIYCFNQDLNRIELGRAISVFKSKSDVELCRISINRSGDGEDQHLMYRYLDVTHDHQIMMRDGTYKQAIDIQPGDQLTHLDMCSHIDPRVTYVQKSMGRYDVYDMVVPGYNNFSANGIFVHNCGEQPLYPNEACNLGSINLTKFYDKGYLGDKYPLDWNRLGDTVKLAVRFLDDVIEVNPYPLPEIDASVKANRRIGLGVMGWADLLFKCGIPYDSEKALSFGSAIMSFIQLAARNASCELAKIRGCFPNWEHSIYKDTLKLRNATVSTIAPTGTISIIANCSSGIEPVFALAFQHKVKTPDGERVLDFFNEIFEDIAKVGGWWSESLQREVLRTGTIPAKAIDGYKLHLREYIRSVFKTAHEINSEWHVRHQAIFQKYTDNGVSKTINLPSSATTEDVARAYKLAYELGCMGITVFRDGCKGTQVLNVGQRNKDERLENSVANSDDSARPALSATFRSHEIEASGRATRLSDALVAPVKRVAPRPSSLKGVTYRMPTPLGTAFVTINEDGGGSPFEVFVSVGKAGSDTAAVSEAVGRLISLVLRMPSNLYPREKVEQIVRQLIGIGGRRPIGIGKDKSRSLPDAIARALSKHVRVEDVDRVTDELVEAGLISIGDLCPDCGSAALVHEEGCLKCYGCGFSEC